MIRNGCRGFLPDHLWDPDCVCQLAWHFLWGLAGLPSECPCIPGAVLPGPQGMVGVLWFTLVSASSSPNHYLSSSFVFFLGLDANVPEGENQFLFLYNVPTPMHKPLFLGLGSPNSRPWDKGLGPSNLLWRCDSRKCWQMNAEWDVGSKPIAGISVTAVGSWAPSCCRPVANCRTCLRTSPSKQWGS